MINKEKKPDFSQDINNEAIDENTERKIHQHLSDKNDIISEEDIKNARTEFNVEEEIRGEQNDSSGEMENDKDGQEEEKSTDEKNEPQPIITPWNILGA